MSINFKLEDFEGPLDLLLFLLQKNKMSIYDIEVSKLAKKALSELKFSGIKEDKSYEYYKEIFSNFKIFICRISNAGSLQILRIL